MESLILCMLRSFEVISGVAKGHFRVKNVKHVQMHIIYIWIDSEFYSDSNSENVQVIGGHPRGHIRSFWGQKSEIRPNAHNIHIDRFRISF